MQGSLLQCDKLRSPFQFADDVHTPFDAHWGTQVMWLTHGVQLQGSRISQCCLNFKLSTFSSFSMPLSSFWCWGANSGTSCMLGTHFTLNCIPSPSEPFHNHTVPPTHPSLLSSTDSMAAVPPRGCLSHCETSDSEKHSPMSEYSVRINSDLKQ